MKIVYLGTPDFAEKPLEKLIENGYEVVAVITQPDKPVGRKRIITPPPVKVLALNHGIKVYQYDKISKEGVEDLKALNPDLMITCAFGQILSQEVLDIPKLGTINVHASLLPKYRGSSPIQWAVINGEKVTGVTIMMTSLGVDEGDIVLQEELVIKENETAGELFDRLSVLGANALIKAVKQFEDGTYKLIPQDNSKATFTKMLNKDMCEIDFSLSAESVCNFIRGLNPWPVATTSILGEVIKVYSAKVVDLTGTAGEILSINSRDGFIVACKSKAIKILTMQKLGGKVMSADDFLRGYKPNKV